jgi:hypothetical protein
MFGAWRGCGTILLGAGFVSAVAAVLTAGTLVGGLVVPCALVAGALATGD